MSLQSITDIISTYLEINNKIIDDYNSVRAELTYLSDSDKESLFSHCPTTKNG